MGGGDHNVAFDDNSFIQPTSPSTANWTVQRTFDTPGTYRYYCQVHGGPMGLGMSGMVVVNAASGGGGGGAPPPNPGPAPAANPAPVVSALASPATQHVGKLYVRASMNEAGTLAATGTVTVPRGAAKVYRFKQAKRTVAANQPVKLRLRLSKHALENVRRALRKHKLRAKVTITAIDAAGKKTIRKLTVRLAR
jgi:hypothetical protein